MGRPVKTVPPDLVPPVVSVGNAIEEGHFRHRCVKLCIEHRYLWDAASQQLGGGANALEVCRIVQGRQLDAVLDTPQHFVVDPDSLKVKWWRMGPWRRQHDPDWQQDGRITVYDNNMHRSPSRIVAISPQTFRTEILANGTDLDFYSWNRGQHQITPGGNLLITIPNQGRVIELDQDGEIVLEFLNSFDQGSNENLLVSEALYLPEDFFEFEEFPSCD